MPTIFLGKISFTNPSLLNHTNKSFYAASMIFSKKETYAYMLNQLTVKTIWDSAMNS